MRRGARGGMRVSGGGGGAGELEWAGARAGPHCSARRLGRPIGRLTSTRGHACALRTAIVSDLRFVEISSRGLIRLMLNVDLLMRHRPHACVHRVHRGNCAMGTDGAKDVGSAVSSGRPIRIP